MVKIVYNLFMCIFIFHLVGCSDSLDGLYIGY